MRKIYRYFLYIIGLIAVTVLGIMFPQYWVKVSAFWPFGYSFILILFIADLFVEILQGKSPQIITKATGTRGYWSINRKDIDFIPCYKINRLGEKVQIGEIAIIFPGGVDYGGINPRSNSDYPVIICPGIYVIQIGKCFAVDCYIPITALEQLPPFLWRDLKYRYNKRIKKKTVIHFGATSTRDGSATSKNNDILESMKTTNEYVNLKDEVNTKYITQIKKDREMKERRLYVKESGSIEEP